MNGMLAFCRAVDWATERLGRTLYWLLLLAVAISTINAIVRKSFDMSSNAYLELQWYLFAAVFMLGAGYAFLHDQHVRIDVIAGRFGRRMRTWIDVVGIALFLLPLCGFVIITSLPSVALAIELQEVSANPGGLIRWPLYILVPIGFGLLAIQSVSELIKRIAFLTGHAADPHATPEPTGEELMIAELREASAREREAAPDPAEDTDAGSAADRDAAGGSRASDGKRP